jgi:[ribosomal protein S18]-alanine N-acetyltransferase
VTPVRRATAHDVDAVAALEAEIFGADAWSPATVADELTGPLRQGLVALDERGEVCGYLVVLGIGDVADMLRIAVAAPRRGRGVASALLRACELSTHQRMVLEVRADNEAALAFYRRHEFAEVTRRRDYYAEGADAVVMQKPLAAADR